jgi:hypothetical protein
LIIRFGGVTGRGVRKSGRSDGKRWERLREEGMNQEESRERRKINRREYLFFSSQKSSGRAPREPGREFKKMKGCQY